MKTKEELNALRENVDTVSKKLHELSDEELNEVIGGCGAGIMDSYPSVSEAIEKLLDAIKGLKENSKQS